MKKTKIESPETKISYKILKAILYSVLLTPIWVWSIFLFPFITSKVLFLRLAIELALVFYIPLALKFPELRPKRNWLTYSVFIYLGILLLTSIFGVNFYKSFWGTVERGEGLVTMFHFGLYFLMLTSVFRTPRDWRRYLIGAVIVISFTGLLSLGQIACGPENFKGLCTFVPPAQGTRVSATIGNAAFYAAFMLFGTMFSLLLAFESKGYLKWLWMANAAFNVMLLIYTQTRGGLIALYVGLFMLALYHVFRPPSRNWRIIGASVSFLMVVLPLLLFFAPNIFPKSFRDVPVVARLLQISINDITTQSRVDTWNASLAGWKDRFLTGWGYENYNLAFNQHFPARIFKDSGSQIWFDRAHNTPLDVAVTSGIIGLAAYALIFFFALRTIYKLLRDKTFPGVSAVILLALLVGYFISNLFVFDTHATYLMFFITLGYLVYLHEANLGKDEPIATKSYDSERLGMIASAIVMILVAYVVNIRPAQANIATISGFKDVRSGQFRELNPAFHKAVSIGTYMDEEIRQHMIEYVRQVGGSGQISADERKALYTFAADQLEKNLVVSPKDAKNYLYLMNFYNVTAQDLGRLDRVFDLGRKALELSPTRMQLFFELGQAAFIMGRNEEGLEYFRKGLELNPEPKESHINYLTAAIFAKRMDVVKAEIEEIKKRGFVLTAKEEGAVANGFGANCDVAEATAHAEAAARLEPKFAAEAEAFIAQIKQQCVK